MSETKVKINKKTILLILVILICLILIMLFSNLFKTFSKEIVAGNLTNMGLAVEKDGVIYYNKYDNGIVKLKGGKEYQITEEMAYSLNIVDDTIYYLTVSDFGTIDIKSVKTNGDELKKVKVIYTNLNKFYVENGYIYYTTNKDGNGIVKLDIKTGEENKIVQANVQDFVVDEGVIYFTDSIGTLTSITTSGINSKVIVDTENIKNIQILKKWIYYYDESENALCKVKKDGTSKKKVSTFVNNEIYNVTSKKIYYFDQVNKQICSSDLKGKTSKVVVKLNTTMPRINIVKDTIYYLDDSKDQTKIYQMFRVKTNGNKMKTIDY